MSKITLSVEGSEPIVIETSGSGAAQSQESLFPRVNLIKWMKARKKLYLSVDDVTNIPEVRKVCDKVKDFAEEKGWTIIKRLESGEKKTLFTELFKGTGNGMRGSMFLSGTEVWKDINGVPVCFYIFSWPKRRAFPIVFFRKKSGGKIFTKQISAGFDLVPTTSRGEDHTTDSIWAGI